MSLSSESSVLIVHEYSSILFFKLRISLIISFDSFSSLFDSICRFLCNYFSHHNLLYDDENQYLRQRDLYPNDSGYKIINMERDQSCFGQRLRHQVTQFRWRCSTRLVVPPPILQERIFVIPQQYFLHFLCYLNT